MPDDAVAQSQQPGQMVILSDGSKHLFPAGTSMDQMRKTLNLGPQPQAQQPQAQQVQPQVGTPQSGKTNWVDTLRPYVAGGAGALAAAGTTLIPGLGETGIPELAADTQTYALVDSLMKYLGANPPKSYTEALTSSEADAAINAVAGKLVGTVFKGAKSFFTAPSGETSSFYKLMPTTSQALEKYGMNVLSKASKFLEDFGAPAAKAKALDRSGGAGFTQALAMANSIDGRTAGINSVPGELFDKIKFALQDGLDTEASPTGFKTNIHYASQDALDLLKYGDDKFKVIDNVIGDPDKLSQVLKVGQLTGSPAMNVRQDLAAYKFMDIVNKATTKDIQATGQPLTARIDPDILSTMWTDPEKQQSYKLLYGKDGMQRVGDFFKDISYTQDHATDNPALGKYLRYGPAGKFFLNASSLLHAVTTGNYLPAGVVAGVQLGAGTVGRFLTNPTTARIMTDMAKGSIKDNPVWTAKMLANGIRNQTVGLVGGDGSTTQGTFEENPQTGMMEFKKD